MNALIREPDPELVKAFEESPFAHVTRSGILVVQCPVDWGLSPAAFPAEYIDANPDAPDMFRYRPNFAAGLVHVVHAFPEQLAYAAYELALEEYEVNGTGWFSQVVTGHDGGRIRSYRHESRRLIPGERPNHASCPVYSAPELGVVRIDANKAQRRGHLSVRRAKVEVVNGLTVVSYEQLFALRNQRLATTKFNRLPEELAAWREALGAIYARLECTDLDACLGHYRLA